MKQIVGVGESVVDFFVQVEESFLYRHLPVQKGNASTVSPSEFDHLLTLAPSPPIQIPGGSAANTLRALAKLGVHCRFVSRMGDDLIGDAFLCNLDECRVAYSIERQKGAITKKMISFITPDGATTSIRTQIALTSVPPQLCLWADWAHFEGWRLDGTSYVEEMLQQALLQGAHISFALPSTLKILEYKKAILALIPHIDLLFCNEEEAIAFTDLPAREACLFLQTLCPIAVVTLGAKGCFIGHGGTVEASPPFPAHPVDTTGAGDHFAAGFLYGMLREFSLSLCGTIGNRLGAAAVEVIGAQLPAESWEKIYRFSLE